MNLPLESYELESPRRLIMAAVETMPVADPVGQEKVPTLPDGAACVHEPLEKCMMSAQPEGVLVAGFVGAWRPPAVHAFLPEKFDAFPR